MPALDDPVPAGKTGLSSAPARCVLSVGGAFCLALYLRLSYIFPAALLLAAGFLTCLRAADALPRLSAWERRWLLAFSALFSVALVLGFHIAEPSVPSGPLSMEELYIRDYSFLDLIAFPFLLFACFLPVRWLYGRLTAEGPGGFLTELLFDRERFLRCSLRNVLRLSCITLLAWGAWLVVYYPGLIVLDTTFSISQALGMTPLNNHHPVAYTLLIKLCLLISSAAGKRNDVGLALFMLMQITVLSGTVSLFLCKLSERFHLRRLWTVLLTLVFSLDPFFGSFSIIFWKDPLFTAALILLIVQLMDLASEAPAFRFPQMLRFGLVLLAVVFFRNNGIEILLLLLLSLFAAWLIQRRHGKASCFGRASLVCLIAAVFFFVVTGPVYKRCGIESPKQEGYGMFLNQMFRVAAYEGSLSESDAAYLDAIFPMEEYRNYYHPNSVDLIKFHRDFHAEPLNDSFFSHYLSILLKNPRSCLEGWELGSYGYWAVNSLSMRRNPYNIVYGTYYNTTRQYALMELDIYPGALSFHPILDKLFPLSWAPLPAAGIFWLLLLLIFCVCAAKRPRLLLPLLPGLFLVLGIIAFAPVSFWVRYVFLIYYLLPFYLLCFTQIGPDAVPDGPQREPW